MNRRLLPVYRFFYKFLAGKGLKKFSIIKNMDISMKKKFYSDYITTVDGLKMNLLEGGGDCTELSVFGEYEPVETEYVKKEIKKDDVVIDVGASVGYYTLLFAKLVGQNGKVYSFESNLINFPTLQKNVKLNNFSNVILENKYVVDKTDKNNNHISLDDYFFNKNEKIDLIKMDIEGAEYLAFKGMMNLLQNNRNIKLLMEFHTTELKKNNVNLIQFLNDLRDLGFSIYNLNEKKQTINLATNEELLLNYPKTEVYTNLLLKRKNIHE